MIRRPLIFLLLLAAVSAGLAMIFAAYQHPALLLNLGNLVSCG